MSLTVALNISFRDDSKKFFRSLDLAMLDRAVAVVNNSPDTLYFGKYHEKSAFVHGLKCLGKGGCGVCGFAAVCGTNKAKTVA